MQLLLIKISDINTVKPEYALLGKKQSEDRFTPGDWSKVRSLTRGRKVVLLVPDTDVVLNSISIPSKNRKQLLQAIPYALEDSLAEDIEDLHFAVHQESDSKESQVAVINSDLLDKYLNSLKKMGITAHFVLPRVLSQHNTRQTWSIQQNTPTNNQEPTVSVKLNKLYGFNCDQGLLDIFLEQHGSTLPESIFTNLETDKLPKNLQNLPQEKLDAGLVYYSDIENAIPLNLVTGFVSRKGSTSSINWKAWRPALVIGSLVGASWLGILAWQNQQLKSQQGQLQQAIENTFKTAFPESRLVDAPQQMRTMLAQLKKNAGQTIDSPLPMIASLAPLLKEYKDLSLSEVRYQENELVIVMQSPNLTRLETFKKDAITKSKLQVDIKSSTTTANKVEATLIISPLKLSNIDQVRA